MALVVNDGPSDAAAAVFTANRVKAAPVLWTQQVIADGRLRAVILNAGGANACTGPAGFTDTHRTAEHAADRLGTSDGTMWQKFDNSTVTGFATLQTVYGQAPAALFRDWAVANYVDDLGVTSDPRYLHKSWNYRDIFTTTFLNIPTYPLQVSSLTEAVRADLTVRGGSAAYLRFAAPASREVLLTLTSGGGAPSSSLQFVVVRTK